MTKVDRHGRQHVRYGKSGELFLFNRARRFQKLSSMSLDNDLHHFLRNEAATGGKKALLLVTDNCPDWNPRSMQTFYALGRLWRDLQLDALVQVTFAVGYSRYNMIERAWAPLSWQLVGVTLPATLPGEAQPPWLQPDRDFTDEQMEEKAKETKEVFDRAIETLGDHWSEVTIDGFQVNPVAV